MPTRNSRLWGTRDNRGNTTVLGQ
jgi:hypothetical protein